MLGPTLQNVVAGGIWPPRDFYTPGPVLKKYISGAVSYCHQVKGRPRALDRLIRQKNYPHSLVLEASQQPASASGCQCTHYVFAKDQKHADSQLKNLRHPTIQVFLLLKSRGWKRLVLRNVCICKMCCVML